MRKTIKIALAGPVSAQDSGAALFSVHQPTWHKPVASVAMLLSMGFAAFDVQALALGRVNVQSALGEPLRAEIDVPDINADEAASLKASVASPDAFKAAGLEYNTVLNSLQISLQKRPDGRSYLRLSSERPMTEPFVDLILEANWAAGRLVRDYTMLFDPPNLRVAPLPAAVTAPVVTSAANTSVATSRPVTSSPAPAPIYITEEAKPPVRSSRTRTASPQRAPRAAKPEPTETVIPSPDEIVVKKGATAAQLAARYKPAGVSLDQMLVAMLSINPEAFVNGNVNRLKAGVVLDMPTAAAVSDSNTRAQARQMIVAQSKDFNEFRRRLAQGAPSANTPTASRRASGSVQAQVQDNKANATTPDKLTLSKAASAAKGAKEEIIAKNKQAKDAASRVADLSKNLQDLAKFGTATSTMTAATKSASMTSAAAVGAAVAAGAAAALPAVTSSASAAAKTAPALQAAASAAKASASATAAAAISIPASASLPSASTTVATARPVASTSTTAQTVTAASAAKSSTVTVTPTAPAPQASASVAKAALPAAPASAPVAEASLVDGLLSNPATPYAAGGLLAALAGLGGLYRWRQRKKADQKDSSFLESRLQPDSFFGASGGQRIDTNDSANGKGPVTGSSSMVYSPSQLDAAGDVDPVAEADVYLAYGRDLQAEEILKEALRMQPTRVAVHAKLLEIYAKRRDTKAFENVAKEAFKITNGQGPEWDTARALGREIDPSNNLYQGGAEAARTASAPAAAPASKSAGKALAATAAATAAISTLAMTATKSAAAAEPDLDFDLDLDFAAVESPGASMAMAAPDPFTSTLPGKANQRAVADAHFATTPIDAEHNTTAMELRSEIDDPLDMGFDIPALPAMASVTRDAVKLSGPDMDSFSSSLSFSAKPPVKSPSISTAPMEMNNNTPAPANGMEFDFGDLSLDLKTPNAAAMSASVAVDAGVTGDPLETKLALAQEFREIGDDDGARSLAQEVAAEATGALKARAQRMVADLS